MFFKSPNYSLAVLLSLSILGCGTMNNPDHLPDVPKDIVTLAKSLRVYERSLPPLPHQSSPIPKKHETKSCTNGGTISFTSDFVFSQLNDENFTLNIEQSVDNCSEDGIIVDGAMNIKIISSDQNQTLTTDFLTDFTIMDHTNQLVVKKDSIIYSQKLDDYTELVTSNMQIVAPTSKLKIIDFKRKEFEKNNISIITNISGKKIINNKVFIVDEHYNHATTPIVYDANGRLQIGGIQQYLDDQNHTIKMEIVDIDTIQISVDIDGDGKADSFQRVPVSTPF